MANTPALPIGRYRASFDCAVRAKNVVFPGNAWRGALGHALKSSVCVTRAPECKPCVLYHSCVYPYFWDTPPHVGATKMRKYETAPHPFVLDCEPDQPLLLGFTLLGQANRHLAVFIHALTKAAAAPRGVAGNVLTLNRIEQASAPDTEDWRVIFAPGQALAGLPVAIVEAPPAPLACTVDIQTPLRVKRDGRQVGAGDFGFADLFANLLRRASMLTYFHTERPLETDFRGLTEAARQVTAMCDLRWREQTRYSQRQHRGMQFGGVVGTITIEDAALPLFWPYLWLGQFTHAGSGATMGMGRYRVVASLPTTTQAAA